MRELGLDRLRGLGVFMVIVLHTAFYHFSGIYGVDLSNPSIIITLIGFLLMFAGLFAMISGAAYTLQYIKHEDEAKTRRLGMIKSGIALWIVAYIYFIVTGPGLIDFSSRSMDESILVALINQGRFVVPSLERWFYVDSLVMLSLNILLLAGFFRLMHKSLFAKRNAKWVLFIAIFFLVLSYVRIPLYIVYLEAVDSNQVILRVGLNYFVNKNNPIFPFFAFALFGVWWALLKRTNSKVLPHVIIVGVILLL